MLEALKKLIGIDQKSVEARKKAAEEERHEREMRVAEHKEALKETWSRTNRITEETFAPVV